MKHSLLFTVWWLTVGVIFVSFHNRNHMEGGFFMLTDDLVEEFQILVQDEQGVGVRKEDVRDVADSIISFFDTLSSVDEENNLTE